MALIKLRFFSESLRMQSEADVIFPQKSLKGEIGGSNSDCKELKSLYLLHGLSDDNTTWLRRTSLERYASDYDICVIMPNCHRSFYTDMKYGGKYFTYITKELPERISEFLNISTDRDKTFIAGNSMGGYGALKAGLTYPDQYAGIGSFSAVADIKNERFKNELLPVFGNSKEILPKDDIFCLAELSDKSTVKPDIFMYVGTEDFLYQDNLKLKSHFEKLNYNFIYNESKGFHNWEYWNKIIKDFFKKISE